MMSAAVRKAVMTQAIEMVFEAEKKLEAAKKSGKKREIEKAEYEVWVANNEIKAARMMGGF